VRETVEREDDRSLGTERREHSSSLKGNRRNRARPERGGTAEEEGGYGGEWEMTGVTHSRSPHGRKKRIPGRSFYLNNYGHLLLTDETSTDGGKREGMLYDPHKCHAG